MNDAMTREKLRKKIKYKKDVNEMWCASLRLADGYEISCSFPGAAKTAKPAARERVIDSAMGQIEHPLPIAK